MCRALWLPESRFKPNCTIELHFSGSFDARFPLHPSRVNDLIESHLSGSLHAKIFCTSFLYCTLAPLDSCSMNARIFSARFKCRLKHCTTFFSTTGSQCTVFLCKSIISLLLHQIWEYLDRTLHYNHWWCDVCTLTPRMMFFSFSTGRKFAAEKLRVHEPLLMITVTKTAFGQLLYLEPWGEAVIHQCKAAVISILETLLCQCNWDLMDGSRSR